MTCVVEAGVTRSQLNETIKNSGRNLPYIKLHTYIQK